MAYSPQEEETNDNPTGRRDAHITLALLFALLLVVSALLALTIF